MATAKKNPSPSAFGSFRSKTRARACSTTGTGGRLNRLPDQAYQPGASALEAAAVGLVALGADVRASRAAQEMGWRIHRHFSAPTQPFLGIGRWNERHDKRNSPQVLVAAPLRRFADQLLALGFAACPCGRRRRGAAERLFGHSLPPLRRQVRALRSRLQPPPRPRPRSRRRPGRRWSRVSCRW